MPLDYDLEGFFLGQVVLDAGDARLLPFHCHLPRTDDHIRVPIAKDGQQLGNLLRLVVEVGIEGDDDFGVLGHGVEAAPERCTQTTRRLTIEDANPRHLGSQIRQRFPCSVPTLDDEDQLPTAIGDGRQRSIEPARQRNNGLDLVIRRDDD